MSDEIEGLSYLSKMAGIRPDWVQAGGGNSSVKTDNNELIVKASGIALSEVERNRGFCILNLNGVKEILKNKQFKSHLDKKEREVLASDLLKETILGGTGRPSIESFFHSSFSKFVLHVHPVAINCAMVRRDAEQILTKLIPNSVLVGYETPGIELSLAIEKKISELSKMPDVIFLKNHGVIVTGESPEDVLTLMRETIEKFEDYFSLYFEASCIAEKLSEMSFTLDNNSNVYFPGQSSDILSLLKKNPSLVQTKPLAPDDMVFLGKEVLKLAAIKKSEFEIFISKNGHMPKVLLYQGYSFFLAASSKKAKEIEEVFYFHLICAMKAKKQEDFITDSELDYLNNWESEKYRQKV